MTQDEEHLKLLSIFHYVLGGISALCAFIPVIHLTIGLMMIRSPETFFKHGTQFNHGTPFSPFIGWFLVILASILILCGLVFAGLVLTAGRFIAQRSHYWFCFVIACIECVFMPFGTVLGVFTIIVLSRESVKVLFGESVLTANSQTPEP